MQNHSLNQFNSKMVWFTIAPFGPCIIIVSELSIQFYNKLIKDLLKPQKNNLITLTYSIYGVFEASPKQMVKQIKK